MPSSRSAPAPLAALAGVVLAFAIAIFLSGPLHGAIASFAPSAPFAKVFRYLLLAGLVTVFLVAARPWRDVPSDVWGLKGRRPDLRRWSLGVATGIGFLVAIAALDALAGHLSFDPEGPHKLLTRLPTILGLLLVLAPLEETFFRGWLLDRFRSRFAERTSHLAVAAVFAGVHAFRERDAPRQLAASASGALDVLAAWGRNLVDWRVFGPSFVGLFLLSLVLSASRRRFGSLWFGVGLHGAAAAWLHVNSSLTERSIERDWTGSKWLYDGVPGWCVLAGVLFAITRGAAAPLPPPRPPDPPPT